MYFEFSLQKMVPLLGALLALSIGIVLFFLTNASLDATDQVSNFMAREMSDTSYWLEFDLFSDTPAVQMSEATSTATAQAVPVLLYHGEGANTTMPLSVFVQQLRTLKAAGWQTITMEQFESFMKDGTPLPAKSFLLTFDDGRKDTFYSVDPVLQELHYTAVMFVITGFSLPADGKESDYYLNKSELQYMVDSGRWELESHGDQDHRLYSVPSADTTTTATSSIADGHFLSDKFWLPAAGGVETTAQYVTRTTNDLQTSKTILQNDFGKPIIGFAFPFNDFGQDTVNFPDAKSLLTQIVPSIYTFGFVQTDPLEGDAFNYPNPATYLIKRIEPESSWSGAYLLNILSDGGPKSLPYTTTSFGSSWGGSWGMSTSTPSGLILSASNSTTGALAFLSGSQEWKNYTVTATVNWPAPNDEISLIARYDQNTNTYLACAFSRNDLFVEEHYADGTQKTLASASYQLYGSTTAIPLSMTVTGSTATCSSSGASVSATAPEAPSYGGVGVQVWDKTIGVAQATVTSFSSHVF